MKLKKYQTYLCLLFLKKFFFVLGIFFCLIIIINFFDEIKFSEKYNIQIFYSIYLSILNAPSLLFEIFPFIFLITVKVFYLNLNDKNEIKIFNSNGVSNLKIIFLLIMLSLIMGIFLLLFYYSFSSNLKSKYLDIKNRYSNNNEYLAVVKDDGLWIKETIDEFVYFIHAEKFDQNQLKSITISETDKYYNNESTIIAKRANIKSKNWYLDDVVIIDKSGNKKDFKSYVHNSSFDGKIISNLFSNLNSLNIFELHNLSNSYLKIGYSNTDIKIHLNKIYSMPVFYILMTILGFVIINKLKNYKSRFFVIIFGIFVSVVVYYLNYFSGVLGNNGMLPIYLSVWAPLLILFLICNIGIIKVNEN
ncbi:LptF/LptG family permease [Candidatus Pelagibacter sp.]|nr:LptF/LptG family permease [Candidatus Pelagibacter sp.]